jgi:hypothetical protein
MTVTSPGLELDLQVRLAASIDGHTAALNREAQWRERVARAITQVPFAGSIDISGGAGSSTRGRDKLQAKTGYIWSVRRLTAYGWSAGTVTAYRNDINGEPVMPFPVPAVNLIGRGEELLMPGDALVWGAAGITLTGTILQYWGVADCFESWYLPYYLS